MSKNKTTKVLPAYNGYIETSKDALIILQSVLNGTLQAVQRRPLDNERKHLIKSGNTFVFIEETSGIKRWTDGTSWSPSRILGRFLIYRELSKNVSKENIKNSKKCADNLTKDSNASQEIATNNAEEVKVPASNTLPSLSGSKLTSQPITAYAMAGGDAIVSSINKRKRDRAKSEFSNEEYDAAKQATILDNYIYRSDGLIKKSISLCLYPNSTYRKTIHLVSYYNTNDVVNNLLIKPSNDNNLKEVTLSFELLEALRNTSLGHAITNKKNNGNTLESHGFVDTDGFDEFTMMNFLKDYNDRYATMNKRRQLNAVAPNYDPYRAANSSYFIENDQQYPSLQQQQQQQQQHRYAQVQERQSQDQQNQEQQQLQSHQAQQFHPSYQAGTYQIPQTSNFNYKYDYGFHHVQHPSSFASESSQVYNQSYYTPNVTYPSGTYTPQTSISSTGTRTNSYGYGSVGGFIPNTKLAKLSFDQSQTQAQAQSQSQQVSTSSSGPVPVTTQQPPQQPQPPQQSQSPNTMLTSRQSYDLYPSGTNTPQYVNTEAQNTGYTYPPYPSHTPQPQAQQYMQYQNSIDSTPKTNQYITNSSKQHVLSNVKNTGNSPLNGLAMYNTSNGNSNISRSNTPVLPHTGAAGQNILPFPQQAQLQMPMQIPSPLRIHPTNVLPSNEMHDNRKTAAITGAVINAANGSNNNNISANNSTNNASSSNGNNSNSNATGGFSGNSSAPNKFPMSLHTPGDIVPVTTSYI